MPYRLGPCSTGRMASTADYFDTAANKELVDRLAEECYLPANKLMQSLIEKYKGRFRLSFAISGTSLALLQEIRPDVVESFRDLADTGCIELLGETYYNSLSWLYDKKEFAQQVAMHGALAEECLGLKPAVLRNTELIYNNELAAFAADAGFAGVLCEGVDKILRGRSANQVYATPGIAGVALLLRNAGLSDDIAFHFGDGNWSEYPLTAEKYAAWIHSQGSANVVNLLLDYETIGIHKKAETGIFEFIEHLPGAILSNKDWQFGTPSEILAGNMPVDCYDASQTISWGSNEAACCVWCENSMQNNTLKKIYSLSNLVHRTACAANLSAWRRLQSADHFYYMSDKSRSVHDAYFHHNPFASAEEAYKNYVRAITDFEIKLIEHELSAYRSEVQSIKYGTLY